jgi:peptide/nickel transport system ATP-binding protein/glutathione transport system ATP-binding protein
MEEGDAKTVLAKPNSDYTKKLISSKPPVRGPRAPLAVDSAEPYQINILEDPILEVRGIRKKFITNRNIFGKPIAYFEAVKGVSFTLNRGESIGIVGESGCGKSTVSKMIIGLEKPDEGAITFRDGRPPIQLVFQDPYASLNPRLTVRQMLREALLTAGSVQEREVPQQIQKLLNEVGLSSDSQERYPHSFSGGQRQRLVIARALAANPSILILDESVAALDVSVQAQVLNLLFQIRLDRGLSYIFISHDLHVVRHMCERVVVMEKGEIVEEGSSDAVLQQPQHPYTRRLLNSIYSLNQ